MLLTSCTQTAILQYVSSLHLRDNEVVLLLFAENDMPDISALIAALNQQHIRFFGGIFPGLIHQNQQVTTGCIIKKFTARVQPFCVKGIAANQHLGMPQFADLTAATKSTAVVLIDGLTPNINRFLEKLNDSLGESCHFIGAGAGSITLKQQPCIFSPEGFCEDAAVVCVLDNSISLGVRHGWEQLAGPLVATQTDGNTILQLNWEPALDVYNQIVKRDCGTTLNHHNFAGIAQGYPFGILREKEDDIVRDPLFIGDNGAIICIGEVPPNTVLYVLKGEPHMLLRATEKAVADCTQNETLLLQADNIMVVDCITRALFLGPQFAREMDIIHNGLCIKKPEQEPFGVLSLGEISSYGDGLLELFNKTIVVGALHPATYARQT
jgi:hypothetical protein